jgi:hypothetical protein
MRENNEEPPLPEEVKFREQHIWSNNKHAERTVFKEEANTTFGFSEILEVEEIERKMLPQLDRNNVKMLMKYAHCRGSHVSLDFSKRQGIVMSCASGKVFSSVEHAPAFVTERNTLAGWPINNLAGV